MANWTSTVDQELLHQLWSVNETSLQNMTLGIVQVVNTSSILTSDQTITATEMINTTSLWQNFSKEYQSIHGYFSLVVCVFGILSNILNIIVLTRKHMHSPVNFILTALAIADILTMSTYPVMAVYLYIVYRPDCKDQSHTKGWMNFIMFNNLFMIACHMMAMWLTVSLAVFRYIFVCKHHLALTMCSMRRARLTVLVVFVVTFLSNIPYIFLYQVKDHNAESLQSPCFFVTESEFGKNNLMYVYFVQWLFGVLIKILPCILLAYLSMLLIIAMQQAKKRRARLLNNVSRVINPDSSNEHNRTTMMLVAVVLCFIITEIPQGIVAWISALDGNFFNNVYIHLGDLMDILVLVNSAVNFILYCIMSQQFRDTFKSLFVTKHFPPLFHRSKSSHTNGGEYSMVHTETTLL